MLRTSQKETAVSDQNPSDIQVASYNNTRKHGSCPDESVGSAIHTIAHVGERVSRIEDPQMKDSSPR